MLEHSDLYISKCIEVGILTKEKIRKYPLRNANLAVILKAYASSAQKPYTISQQYDYLDIYSLYLTDDGFEWLLLGFTKHSLGYLRSTYGFVFSKATPEDVMNVYFQGYGNFRGDTGVKPKAGIKQGAVLVRTVGRVKKEYKFETLREARKEVLNLSRFYPIDQFTLYRIRKNTKKGKVTHYREKIKLFIETSKRGVSVNLPHLRK